MIPALKNTNIKGVKSITVKGNVPSLARIDRRFISLKKLREMVEAPGHKLTSVGDLSTRRYKNKKTLLADITEMSTSNGPFPSSRHQDLNEYFVVAQYLKEQLGLGESEEVGEELGEGADSKDLDYFIGKSAQYLGGYQNGKSDDQFLSKGKQFSQNDVYDEEDQVEVRDIWELAKDHTDPKKYHEGFIAEIEKWNPALKTLDKIGRVDYIKRTLFAKKYLKAKRKFYKENGMDLSKEEGVGQYNKEYKEMIENFNVSRYGAVVDVFEMIKEGCGVPQMWELYIQSLEFTGNNKEVITNAKTMWSQKINMSSIVFSKLIKAYITLGLPDRVDLWIKRMKKRGISGTIELYNSLILMQLGKLPVNFDEVSKIISEIEEVGLKPNSDTLEALMLCHASVDRYDEVKNLHTEYSKKYNTKLSRIGYALMAEHHLFNGEVKEAMKFWNILDNLRLFPRTKTYNLLIQHYLKEDNPKKAEEIYSDLRSSTQKPNLATYKYFQRYFSSKPDPQGMLFVLSRMTTTNIIPDREILELTLDGFFNSGLQKEFDDIFNKLLERQMRPARKYYGQKLELLQGKDPNIYVKMIDELEYMKQSGIEPTKDELRIVINEIQSSAPPELASKLLADYLDKFNAEVDSIDHVNSLKAFMLKGDIDSSQSKYSDITKNGLTFSEGEAYSVLIEFNVLINDLESASKLWDSFKKAILENNVNYDPTHIQRIALYLSRAGVSSLKIIEDIYLFLKQSKPEYITIDIFEIIINLKKRVSLEETLLYLKEASNSKVLPNGAIYKSVFESIAVEIDTTKNSKLLTTAWDLMTEAIVNPTMAYIPIETLNQFLLIMIKYGTSDVYDYALSWYKKANSESVQRKSLDAINSTLFKNWLKSSTSMEIVPKEFIERDLQYVYFTAIKQKF